VDDTPLDPRLHAYRGDLAEEGLAGRIEAARFAAGHVEEVIEPVVALRSAPRHDAMRQTELLLGERATVFERTAEGWAWVKATRDGYVGYAPLESLSRDLSRPTHRICLPSTFLYDAPDVKSPPRASLPMNAAVEVTGEAGRFARTGRSGFIPAAHLEPLGAAARDFVAVAEQYLHVPYLWGGRTQRGIDCSGLVQTALHAAGCECPRDTDMQERALGTRLNDERALRRGDLVFWQGHVGIMVDGERLLHANTHHLCVALEVLGEARARIAAVSGDVTSVRRL
jgi:cell wall-associated NlpC family hydrolase